MSACSLLVSPAIVPCLLVLAIALAVVYLCSSCPLLPVASPLASSLPLSSLPLSLSGVNGPPSSPSPPSPSPSPSLPPSIPAALCLTLVSHRHKCRRRQRRHGRCRRQAGERGAPCPCECVTGGCCFRFSALAITDVAETQVKPYSNTKRAYACRGETGAHTSTHTGTPPESRLSDSVKSGDAHSPCTMSLSPHAPTMLARSLLHRLPRPRRRGRGGGKGGRWRWRIDSRCDRALRGRMPHESSPHRGRATNSRG